MAAVNQQLDDYISFSVRDSSLFVPYGLLEKHGGAAHVFLQTSWLEKNCHGEEDKEEENELKCCIKAIERNRDLFQAGF